MGAAVLQPTVEPPSPRASRPDRPDRRGWSGQAGRWGWPDRWGWSAQSGRSARWGWSAQSGRSARWGSHRRVDDGIVIPGEANSPLDRHPTLIIPAAVIAACLADARAIRRSRSRMFSDMLAPSASPTRTEVGPI